MSTYSHPGVFIEESLQPFTDPVGAGLSTAAFVGTSTGGPVGPELVSSWTQFQNLFGDIRNSPDDLHYALWQFFSNGGHQAYVVRAARSDAVTASLLVKDSATVAADTMKVTASAPGSWASTGTSRVLVTIAASTSGRFDLTIQVGDTASPVAREQFLDLSLDPIDGRNALAVVNSPSVGSRYVRLEKIGDWVDVTSNPKALTSVPLTSGSDGVVGGTADLVAAAKRLEGIDQVLNLNLPGVDDQTGVLTSVINWAAARTNVFVVADSPKPSVTATDAAMATDLATFAGALPQSSYVAVYGPWLYLADPASSVPGAMRLVAPGGAVLGQYAYTDAARGAHKAPAGITNSLRGVLGVRARFNETQLDTLNQAGANVIRAVTGAGFCVMGARTLNKGMPDRYLNVRRVLMVLAKDLREVTQFAIFEPNDATLWERIGIAVEQYLVQAMQSGVLKGSTPDESFFVRCDESNNPPSNLNAGIVNVEVGVAVHNPAEFIIIRIGQFTGGTTTEITTT